MLVGQTGMSRSTSEREAKEFIVSEIADEARRTGVSFSEVERKMLFFSETDLTVPDISEVVQTFNRDYDDRAYEQKVAGLINSARQRADRTKRAAWRRAEKCLARGDHYLGVILNHATDPRGDTLSWRDLAFFVTVLAGFFLFEVAVARYLGHAPSKQETSFFVWLICLAMAAVYVVVRVCFGQRAVDRFVDAVMRPFFGGRK